MDGMEQIRYRLRVSNLEGRMTLHEIEAEVLGREIDSSLTPEKRKVEAKGSRDNALAQRAQVKSELEHLRKSYPGSSGR